MLARVDYFDRFPFLPLGCTSTGFLSQFWGKAVPVTPNQMCHTLSFATSTVFKFKTDNNPTWVLQISHHYPHLSSAASAASVLSSSSFFSRLLFSSRPNRSKISSSNAWVILFWALYLLSTACSWPLSKEKNHNVQNLQILPQLWQCICQRTAKMLHRKPLPCLDFNIFQVFFLLQEEVVLFCKLRFQFSYPFLGSIEPLALLLNTRLCFLQFFPKSSVQHFNLLEANNTMVKYNLILCYFYWCLDVFLML